jgi:hypothetical protein
VSGGTFQFVEDYEPALTRADIVAARGPDLRPVPKPAPVKRTGKPVRHGTRYRWTKGCRCSWCHAASLEHNRKTHEGQKHRKEEQRLKEAKQ